MARLKFLNCTLQNGAVAYLQFSVIDQDQLVTYKFEFSSVNSGGERRLIVLWELNKLLSSSYATRRTLTIVNLEFVY